MRVIILETLQIQNAGKRDMVIVAWNTQGC